MKWVMLTFDDGNYDNYQYAFPILKKYNLVGVFYIVSNSRGIPNTALKEMSDAGMVIESHSATHPDLTKINKRGDLRLEISSSKYTLQAITGKTITSFSYPGCGANSQVVSMVIQSGYKLAFSCGTSIDHRFGTRYTLSRVHVYNNLKDFKQLLSGHI